MSGWSLCLWVVLLVFGGVLVGRGWVRPGLPCLPLVFGPIQHCTSAVPDAWRDSVSADLCCSKGFRSTLFWDYHCSMQLLNSFHVRDRDEALLRGFLSGSVGDGFLLGHINGDEVPCRFCGGPDGHGQKFWDRTCEVARDLDVWTDGSLVHDEETGASAAGAGGRGECRCPYRN